MLLVKYILVIAHIATAAAWFGLALRLAGQARSVMAVSGEARSALAKDVGKSISQGGRFILLTFIFGTANIIIAESGLEEGQRRRRERSQTRGDGRWHRALDLAHGPRPDVLAAHGAVPFVSAADTLRVRVRLCSLHTTA